MNKETLRDLAADMREMRAKAKALSKAADDMLHTITRPSGFDQTMIDAKTRTIHREVQALSPVTYRFYTKWARVEEPKPVEVSKAPVALETKSP